MITRKMIIENGYFVYKDGNVYSNKSNKFLKYRLDKHGYKRVNLRINNTTITIYISNLVMLFYNKDYKYIGFKDVLYINNNKLDTNIHNLFLKN